MGERNIFNGIGASISRRRSVITAGTGLPAIGRGRNAGGSRFAGALSAGGSGR